MLTKRGLTSDEVIKIFTMKPFDLGRSSWKDEGKGVSFIANLFGVSSKTIRDIWSGRTWYRETYHLDPYRSDATERLLRRPGRPKGSKDRKQRVYKRRTFQDPVSRHDSKNSANRYAELFYLSFEACTGPSQFIVSDLYTFPELLEGEPNSSSFRDPFHDDWSFWPSEGGVKAASNL